MKSLLMLCILLLSLKVTKAQTAGATTANQKKSQINKQEKKRIQRGTGQYYGSKDTTPGSPVGTGGAGGDMSGSPAASAIETEDQAIKADVNKNVPDSMAGDTTIGNNTQTNPAANKKTKSSSRKTKNL
jgi:hypothetical protein